MKCVSCGGEVSAIAMGLTKKLINRGATAYLCKKCLAEKFQVTEEFLDQKAREFREYGCTLFPPD